MNVVVGLLDQFSMGQMRFNVPSRDKLPPGSLERAYLCGLEGVPWRARSHWIADENGAQGEFVVERAVDESGSLFVPWLLNGLGELVLSTASLMERSKPYDLTVEVARGLLNQVRSQSADWQMLGLQLPDDLVTLLKEAAAAFAEAVTTDVKGQADLNAEATIKLAGQAAEILMHEYSRQALAVRHQQAEQLPTMLGVALGARPANDSLGDHLLPAINTVSLKLRWSELEPTAGKRDWEEGDRQVAWCQEKGLRVIGGPLLHLSSSSVPHWLRQSTDDFDQVQAYVNQHVESVVQRYQGRVQIWNCSAGMNVKSDIAIDEENKLRLVVSAMDQVRQNDPSTPMIISFDQPWGEYLAFDDVDLSPLHFADSLVRAELGVAGIGLEINLGYWPGGTLPRSRLEFSRMLDRWSMLNLPLIVFLTIPGAAGSEATVTGDERQPLPDSSLAKQAELAAQILPVLMAKSFVQGIVWNQLSDVDSDFAGGGLFDTNCQPKPALQTLIDLRRQHLT